jgi:hypothetical protein
MEQILHGLPFVFIYLDIIQHVQRSGREGCGGSFLPPPFRGLVINDEKCECAVPEVQLLGQHTTTRRISPLQERAVATQNHPKPATVR